jgi:hypothetical protein
MLDRVARIGRHSSGALIAVGVGFVAGPAPNRRGRPRRLLISIAISLGGRFVQGAIRPSPTPDTAIAIRVRRPIAPVIAVRTAIASVRIIAVVTAVAPVTIAPLVKFAFDVATLVNRARSRV